MVHPIFGWNQMLGEIKVVKFLVWIIFLVISNDESALNTVGFLMSRMCVVKVRACILSMKSITELCSERNWALNSVRNACLIINLTTWQFEPDLSHIRHSVHELCSSLSNAMPVNCRCNAFSFVREINYDNISFADVNGRSRKLKVDCQKASAYSVS